MGRASKDGKVLHGCSATLPIMSASARITRRRLLQQTIAFSALHSLGRVPTLAAPAARNPINAAELLVVGDWGWTDADEGQRGVAHAMRDYARERQLTPEALLLLGDSWYGDLPGGAQSPRWKTQFEVMYPADVFPGRAYTILGNHDYQKAPESKVMAELEYAKHGPEGNGNTRWTLPSPWYRFELPEKDPLMTVLALDSNVPGYGTRGLGFYTMSEEDRIAQLHWFEKELSRERKTPFLAVMGHHPIYSNGKHGDHPQLIRDWDPLLRKYKVNLYLAGHDHDLQHLEFAGHPTSFFCSGAGGANLYNIKIAEGVRGPFARKLFGFSHISLTRNAITLRHVDSKGNVLHAFTKLANGDLHLLQTES